MARRGDDKHDPLTRSRYRAARKKHFVMLVNHRSAGVSTMASSSTPSTGVSLFGSSPMGGHMAPATAVSPPNMGDASGGGSGGGDYWAATWHDSGKMNVSSGSSNRSAVSSPPAAAVNPFTGATNLTQLNTSPWPSSSGTSPVSQPAKNHHQQQQPQQQRNPPVPPRQQQSAQPQATFTPQWPPSSSSSSAMNDPFNISNVTSGGGWLSLMLCTSKIKSC